MKKLLSGILVLLLLLVGAVLIAPSLIDWTRYKDDIARHVGWATGRELTIEGGIDLALLPRPMLRVQGVRLASLPGAADADLARLGELHVEVALMPLLGGQIQVESIALIEPTIMLEVLPDGRRTWNFGPADRHAGAGLLDSVSLDQVRIENGTIVYRNALTGASERFEHVNANIVAGSLVGPFQIQTNFSARGVPLTAELSAGRIGEGGAMPLRATLRLRDTESALRFAGIIITGPVLKAQGDLRAEGTDLRPALTALRTALRGEPAGETPKVFSQPFNIRTAVNASALAIELNSIEAQVGDTRGTGKLRLVPFDPKVGPDELDLTFNVNRLDLDSWLALTKGSEGEGKKAEDTGFSLPKDLDARFDLSVEALSWNGGIARQGRFEGRLADGVLNLSGASALLPGGADVALAGKVGARDGSPVLGLQVKANADNLRALLGWLGIDVSRIPADRLRKAAVTTQVDGQPEDLRLTGLELNLDTSVATGAVAYAYRDGRPAFGVRIAIDRLNLDGYLPRTPEGRPDVDPAALLSAVDANIEARLGSITVGGMTGTDLDLNATLAGGGLVVSRFQAKELAGAKVDLQGAIARLKPLDGMNLSFSVDTQSIAPWQRHLAVESLVPPERIGPVKASGRLVGGAERLEVNLDLSAASGRVEAGGVVTQPLGTPTFDLKVRGTWAKGEDLTQVLWPDWRPRDVGTLDLYAEVAGSEGAMALSGIQGMIGPTPVTGEATVDLAGDIPVVEAKLSTGELVIDRFLDAPAPGVGRRFDVPIGTGWLGALTGHVSLTAKGLALDDLHAGDTALNLRLEKDAAVVERLDGGLLGGRLGLEGKLSRNEAGSPVLAAKGRLVGATLADGFVQGQDGDPIDLVGGTFDLEFEGTAAGSTRPELIAALDGGGRIIAHDGALAGLDLGQIAGKPEALVSAEKPGKALEQLLERSLSGGKTPYRSLQAGFKIEDGNLRTDDLAVDAESGAVTGSGGIDLKAGTLDLALKLAPANFGDLPPFALTLAGPLDDPIRTVEAEALTQAVMERAEAARKAEPEPKPEPAPTPMPTPMPKAAMEADIPEPKPIPAPPEERPSVAGAEVIDGILDRLKR